MQQDSVWEYYQNKKPEIFDGSRPRLARLAGYLRRNCRVLNIGVGSGILEDILLKRGHDVYTLDPSSNAIERVKADLKLGDNARVGRVENMPFDNDFFDAVFISEVIEHLSPEITKRALQEIQRTLKTGGRIIGTVPARENFTDNMVICPHCEKLFHRWGHLQRFDRISMKQLLSSYFLVQTIYERSFPSYLNFKGRLSSFVRRSLNVLGVHGANEVVVFTAKKQ